MYIERRKISITDNNNMSSELLLGKLNFIDLAGMERQVTQHYKAEITASSSAAAKESHHIHLSLNALGRLGS